MHTTLVLLVLIVRARRMHLYIYIIIYYTSRICILASSVLRSRTTLAYGIHTLVV